MRARTPKNITQLKLLWERPGRVAIYSADQAADAARGAGVPLPELGGASPPVVEEGEVELPPPGNLFWEPSSRGGGEEGERQQRERHGDKTQDS